MVKPVRIVGFAARAARDRHEAKNRRDETSRRELTFGSRVTGSNVEAGSSQGMAALDSAARPANVEGKKTSREAARVQPDASSATGKGAGSRCNWLGRSRWIKYALKRKSRNFKPVGRAFGSGSVRQPMTPKLDHPKPIRMITSIGVARMP